MFLLACTLCLSVCAMAQTAFYVYQTDGSRVKFTIADVDSISFTVPKAAIENGHEWVDLGLPSGLKWATCNVGAYTPEAYGNYYAWGETESKYYYSGNSYKFDTGGETFTKYNGTDGKTTLDPEDDAAAVNWGGKWRMPTNDEWGELIDECAWTWTTLNGVNGYEVKSKTNGNSIFLPAAGCRLGYGSPVNAGNYGYYSSSSLYPGDPDYPDLAWPVLFGSDYVNRDYESRYVGQSVRPVVK